MPLVAKVTTPHPLRGSSPRRGAFKRSLQLDLKVWFDFLGNLDDFLQDGIELVVVGFQHHIRYGYWVTNMTKRTIVTNMTNITVISH